MYAGRIVETASVRELFERPAHPYSRALMACMPIRGLGAPRLRTIPGQAPQPGTHRRRLRLRTALPGRAAPIASATAPPRLALAPGHEALCLYPVTDGRPL